MTGLVDGKAVLVTGAGSGIGEAVARLFAHEGARIGVADLSLQAAERVCGDIAAAGGQALAIEADVSDEAQVEAMLARMVDRFGRLDGAVNNAGVGQERKPLPDMSRAEFEAVLAVNVVGVFLCMKHEIPRMLEHGGSIVNIASMSGVEGVPMMSAYSASKHAVNGLTKSAAVEFGRRGVRINSVCPGTVNTPAIQAYAAAGVDFNAIIPTPIGRIAESDEVAQAALWLISDRSSYVTGLPLWVDGGMNAAPFVVP